MDHSQRDSILVAEEANSNGMQKALQQVSHKFKFDLSEVWTTSSARLFSVKLSIPNTPLSGSGSGISKDRALAMSYNEFMAHFQNQLLFRRKIPASKFSQQNRHYYFAADELRLSFEEFMAIEHNVIEQTIGAKVTSDFRHFCDLPATSSPQSSDRTQMICLPFGALRDGKMHYLPLSFLDTFYGTSGMCAGNTEEEALLHGLSEAIEIYVATKAQLGEFVPPVIPRTALTKYPHIIELMEKIEAVNPFYHVDLLDCSLSENFPCVGMRFVCKDRGAYLCSMAVHPRFDVAAENCLTKFCQGSSLDNPANLVAFNFLKDPGKISRIIADGFESRNRCYPAHFFMQQNPSYPYSLVHFLETAGEGTEIAFLMQLIIDKGFDILVRDTSLIAGFSYQVIIPNFSNLKVTADTQQNYEFLLARKSILNIIQSLLLDPQRITAEQIDSLIAILRDEKYFDLSLPFQQIYPVPLKRSSILNNHPLAVVGLNLSLLRKQYDSALFFAKRYLSILWVEAAQHGYKSVYLRGLIAYLEGVQSGFQHEVIQDSLKLFFPESVITKVLEDLASTTITTLFPELRSCQDCSDCRLHNTDCCIDEFFKCQHVLADQAVFPDQNQALRRINELMNTASNCKSSSKVPIVRC